MSLPRRPLPPPPPPRESPSQQPVPALHSTMTHPRAVVHQQQQQQPTIPSRLYPPPHHHHHHNNGPYQTSVPLPLPNRVPPPPPLRPHNATSVPVVSQLPPPSSNRTSTGTSTSGAMEYSQRGYPTPPPPPPTPLQQQPPPPMRQNGGHPPPPPSSSSSFVATTPPTFVVHPPPPPSLSYSGANGGGTRGNGGGGGHGSGDLDSASQRGPAPFVSHASVAYAPLPPYGTPNNTISDRNPQTGRTLSSHAGGAPLPPPPLAKSSAWPVTHGSDTPMSNGSQRRYAPPPGTSYTPQQHQQQQQYQQQQHQQQQQQQQYQDKPKIDPTKVPRPPLFTRPQQESGVVPVYYPKQATCNNPIVPPPAADSRYSVVDDGNASPDFLRSSVYAVPLHRGLWHQTGDVPLGVICTPLFAHGEDFIPRPRRWPNGETEFWKDPQAVPVMGQSTFPTGAPPRCGQCYAYTSPFFGTDGTCNLCGTKNRNLVGPQLHTGLPSMQFGTVEYDVAGPYVTRTQGPVQPISLYALDVTSPDVVEYAPILERIGMDMAEHVQRQRQFGMGGPPPAPPRIGICLVSCRGIRLRLDSNRCAVVSDVTEQPFVPFPLVEWTFDLSNEAGITAWQSYCQTELVSDISEWRQVTARSKVGGGAVDSFELTCGGAALQFLSEALAESGGRGTWMSWRRSNYGVGRLPHRVAAAEDDATPYIPLQLLSECKNPGEQEASSFYKELGSVCTRNRVSLDVFMVNTRSTPTTGGLEIATMGELCKGTSGKLTWIDSHDDWRERLQEELTRRVQAFTGWDAVFKVRCSDGLQVKSIFSSGGSQIETLSGGSSELELSMVNSNTCIAVELEHRVGGIPKDRSHVFIQTALLYSTLSGRRRVRVSTLALRTTSIVNDTYRSVDFAVVTTLLTRSAVDCFRTSTSENERSSLRSKARDGVYNRCVHILANYRQHTPASNSPMGQLLLPERMQLLPLFCMCLLKSPMLRPSVADAQRSGTSPTIDERAFYMLTVGQVMPSFSMLMVHPNIFAIGSLDNESVGEWHRPDEMESVNGFIRMPPTLGPSMESMEDNDVYLIDDGFRIYQFFGRFASGETKHFLLSGESNEMKTRVDGLIYQMRVYSSTVRGEESELRPSWAPVVTVLQEEGHLSPKETEVMNLMVLDATTTEKDYVDFLCTLHHRIREIVEGSKKT